MNNKNGFSLISFLLYLTLFSMIALFTAHIITSLLLPTLSATRRCKSLIALHIASDLFVRDIRTMRNKPHSWKVTTSHELIWHIDDDSYDIGWRNKDNRLERIEGLYSQGWKHKKVSVVATGITQGTFTIETHNNHIIGVEMALIPAVDPKKTIKCYVATQKQEKI
jgi:hypothetical protein